MKEQSLSLLESLMRDKGKREEREIILIKPHDAPSPKDWFMHLPVCFNDALDIKQTERIVNGIKAPVWTQGRMFSFSAGDTIYDTPEAYKEWSYALKHIKRCVKVIAATSAGVTQNFDNRYAGSVKFLLLAPNEDRTALVEENQCTMSQDEFVRYLIVGRD